MRRQPVPDDQQWAVDVAQQSLQEVDDLQKALQRYHRGDLDEVKNQRAVRDIPMGYLVESLRRKCTGDPERFVFSVKTKYGECRDDRDINPHFLRPAAKVLLSLA